MKKRSCLNCAYMGRNKGVSLPGVPKIVAVPESKRFLSRGVNDGGLDACARGQWERDYAFHSPQKEILAEAQSENPDDVLIMTQFDITLSVSKHSCKYFYPFKKLGTRTLEQCWTEQQESQETCRFKMRFVLSFITAIGVVLTAVFSCGQT